MAHERIGVMLGEGCKERNLFKEMGNLSMFKYYTKKMIEKKRLKILEGKGDLFSALSPDKAGVDDQEYQYRQLFLFNRKPIRGRAQI